MRRVMLVGFAVLIACPGDVRTCAVDGDCVGGVCRSGTCVAGGTGGGATGTGGGATGVGGGGGGATGGGSAGGMSMSPDLVWVSPDGGRTTATSLPLLVRTTPASFDAGAQLSYVVTAPDGGTSSGSLSAMAPSLYGGATTPALTEGVWRAAASAAGLDASISFVVDRSAPVFTVTVAAPPARYNNALVQSEDPVSFPSWNGARPWRRDENALIRVTSPEADVLTQATAVRVGPAQSTASRTACVSPVACPGAGYCECFAADLGAAGTLDAFRGVFQIEVAGSDLLGNTTMALADAGIAVTRWRWARVLPQASGPLLPLALDSRGNVIAASPASVDSIPRDGFTADGGVNWRNDLSVTAPPVISSLDAGRQGVLVPQQVSAGVLGVTALDSADGGALEDLLDAFSTNLGVNSSLALGTTQIAGDVSETYFAPRQNQLTARRFGTNSFFPSYTLPAAPIPGSSTIVKGDRIFYSTSTTRLDSLRIAPDMWADAGWTSFSGSAASRLGAVGTDVIGVSNGALFRMPSAGGTAFAWRYPASGTTPGVLDIAVDDSRRVFFNQESPNGFSSIAIDGTSGSSTPTSAGSFSAPILGEGQRAYTMDLNGTVHAWSRALVSQWTVAVGDGGTLTGATAPTIDVARDQNGAKDCARPGVLYVGWTPEHRVYAFIVDSKGIDATAAWPKYQHDPRNTGNADTNLSEFSCP